MKEQFGNITLIQGDCMDYLRTLSDNAFDLAIVDPPYGIGAPNMQMGATSTHESTSSRLKNRLNSGGGKLKDRVLNNSKIGWDIPPSQEYFNELFRVSKNQVIWGGNYFNLPPTRCILCWDKEQPWEDFSQVEIAWTSFDKPAKLFRLGSRGGANKELKIHPTQKPVQLYKWIMNHFIKGGNKILDTHLGSGSICIAAHDMGFEMTGIELDPEYYAAARQRLINHQMQQKLF